MDIRLVRGTAANIVERWERQYHKTADTEKSEITKKLRAFHSPSVEEVEKIIGNESWTKVWCGSCLEYKASCVQIGSGDETVTVCATCLACAALLLRECGT